MMVNVHEAKTHLSKLLALVAAGEEVIVARSGKPVARLVAYREERAPRRPGRLKGAIVMAPDFDHTPDELIDAFEG
jgi:prevent-host-death family protein